jgi:hypothetical protein
VTGPELASELDAPLAVAAVEAAKLRAEAWAPHDFAADWSKVVDFHVSNAGRLG